MAWMPAGICAISVIISAASPAMAQDDILIMPEDMFQENGREDSVANMDFLESLISKPANDSIGQVRLFQDYQLLQLIGRPGKTTPDNISVVEGKRYLVMTGYRVQAFSGNNQSTAKQEAFQREIHLKAFMPDLTTYVRYSAPFWRLRVGDCLTYEEAYELLLKFQKTFVYGREMSIVREKINVPLD